MDYEELLRDEIVDDIQRLGGINVGTDEFKSTVDGVTKLMDRSIELKKLNMEREAKERQFEEERKQAKFEQDLKLKQMDEDRKDRLIKNCIAAAGIIIPVGLTVWGTLKSFKFEEEGTITTIMGRGFINKLLPKK